jgi:PmbA protein
MARDLPDLELDHPWDISPEDAIALALRCEHQGVTTDPRVRKTDNVSFNSHRGVRCYGNSNGFIAAFPSTRHSISASMIAEDSLGMQRDYWYTVARDANDLSTPESVGRIAAERAARRLGVQGLSTGQYPVLMVPEVARSLFGHVLSALKGGAQYRGATYLKDKLGAQVLPNWISLIEKPRIKKALGSSNFDDDGVATYEHEIIRDGVVQSYILSTYSARRLGLQSTGNAGGVHNIDVASTRARSSPQQLQQQMGEGVVITSLLGQGVNIVNGDYSRGASGFYVRNGEIVHPIDEITIAGNLMQMLNNIVALGDDIDYQSSLWTGSVLISEMTVASQQE